MIADGMFADNTGVAQAVAAGATVVTTFQNDGCAMIWDLFIDQPPLHEPIFERMNAEAAYNANKTCVTLDSDRKFLQSFCMGTITATTIDQPLFGISAGQTVHLNLVCPDAGLNVFSPVPDILVAMRELMETMALPDNAAILQEKLDQFLLHARDV